MADYGRGEKQSIKDSVKSLKKYGSTCNHLKRPESYITHEIEKTDTLQGIALKYNTTTEQIRRANKLFTNDSLFLRGSLKIPVVKEGNCFPISNHSNSGSTSETMTSSMSFDSITDDEGKSIEELLGKIDNSIASTKAQVKQVQENSSFLDPTDPAVMWRRENNFDPAASSDPLATPHPVVLNKGRKVKNSLQRLEKEKDELFEL